MRKLMNVWVLALVVLGLVAAGCSSDSSNRSKSTTTTTTAKATGTIKVSDAASLTEAFAKIGTDFKAANPGAIVTFNPGSSTTLATQIQQTNGVGIDTFASADEANMDNLVRARLIDGEPVVFATNKLVIVTKPGNPKKVKTLADLANLNVVSLCGATAPCGKYATQILQTAGVTIPETKITRGVDVKGTLAAVTTGDADAAIVYVTDAKTAGSDVTMVTIPSADNAIATYPIATLTSSGNKATSKAFIAYLMSPKGQATLRSFGFLPPS
ncbi:MAG: molybdate ABC transporter substrate-binding protein [Acidimicrobiia bacterium]